MFESAAIAHHLDKETYERDLPKLREQLLAAQSKLLASPAFAVMIVITGQDLAGKGELIQRLYEWLDPRYLVTNAYDRPTDDERLRPKMWRYWRDLPPAGRIGIVFGSWYNSPLLRVLEGKTGQVDAEIEEINRFEQMLTQERILLLKVLPYVTHAEMKRRHRKLKRSPYASRHVLEEWAGLQVGKRQEEVRQAVDQVLRRTSTAWAPWVILPADDTDYRDMAFGRTVLEAVERRMESPPESREPASPALVRSLDGRTVLDALDLSLQLDKATYAERSDAAQYRLAQLTDSKPFRKRSLVIAFEGSDAAGKGSSIRRLTNALDPRRFRIHPIAAPSEDEKARPYLWRFWRDLPRAGHVAVFDRSWYGRLLVERVEGFCSDADWYRAYSEINDFEAQITAHGGIVVKFWLAISSAEQLRRFEERQDVAYKQFKITQEDWRNRQKWPEYAVAVNDMVDRTSTLAAPWTLVEAEDKRFARVKVLETVVKRLEAEL